MTSTVDVFDRARSTNPVPRVDTVPDDLLVEVSVLIDSVRREPGDADSKADQEPHRNTSGRRSWRPAVAFAAALVVTLAAVGAVAVFNAMSSEPIDVSNNPSSIVETTLAPVAIEAAPNGPVSADAVPSGPVTITIENLTGHLGDGLSGLLQRYDPESDIDPSSGMLFENIASFAVEVDADPFSISQVLREFDVDTEDYSFSEAWRYLGREAAIPAGVYRLTVWAGPDYCCFLYTTSPEISARRCQMWVTVTGEGQTIHVKKLGASGVHCNPDEPLQPLP